MGRYLVLDALAFLLPFAAYAVWLMVTRGSLRNVEDWQARTIAVLAIAGAALLLVALVTFTSYRVIPPGGTYTPAHMENGKIVPGHIDPDPGGHG
jgi:cytochrome c biogenesis factor